MSPSEVIYHWMSVETSNVTVRYKDRKESKYSLFGCSDSCMVKPKKCMNMSLGITVALPKI
jgi:hypothetical protein